LTIKIFIYCVREEEESIRHSAQECHPPPVVWGWGYDLLEKNIMDKKLKRLKYVISPPSPPSRHEKWKLAKTKPRGQMTSPQALEIAQRIVS